MTSAHEVNFDGLVGPTHNYAGLSVGNVASRKNIGKTSYPKRAALQGLEKMRAVHSLGVCQAVLPPQARPDLETLTRLGFAGSDAHVLERAAREAPVLLAACYSASSMWTANAATVAPSADTEDERVHFTPANLENKLHRSIEHPTTGRALAAIFANSEHFVHHPALPSCDALGDEGAANHTRFCASHGAPGVQLFVFGRSALDGELPAPKRFPARQTLEASQAIARLHRLSPSRVVFAQQNPEVIDDGVFHNDVIAVGNGNVLFHHEHAFLDRQRALGELNQAYATLTHGEELEMIEVPSEIISVKDAVASYLFNSQLLSLPEGKMALVAPVECAEREPVKHFLDGLVAADNSIKEVLYLDVRESMDNGGGPACLRLRVVLNDEELAATNQNVFYDSALHDRLQTWVQTHYRDELLPDDLRDPALLTEGWQALDELTQILGLGSIYPFQS